MIKCENISKTLGNFKLENINFEFPKGYLIGLVGRNGAGKTSLINILLGLYKPDQGRILIDGKSFYEDEIAIRNDLGFVLQDDLFQMGDSLEDNANSFGRFYARYDKKKMMDLLREFDLDLKLKYSRLSKGEKLKFQFAFALAHDPKLLILDEPTANFDHDFRQTFFEKLNEFRSDGEHTVVLATHLTEDLDMLSDYLLYLQEGQVLFAQETYKILEHFRVIDQGFENIELFNQSDLIAKEKLEDGSVRCFIRNRVKYSYQGVKEHAPSIEELMFYLSKRGKFKDEWKF